MNTRKLAAVVIMILIVLFPFRWAYLELENFTGIKGVIMFLITLLGIFFSMYLYGKEENDTQH